MPVSLVTSCNRIAFTTILALIFVCLAQAAPDATSDIAVNRLEQRVNHQITTLTVIMALSGKQLAGFGAGYVLPMSLLGGECERRILDAAEKTIVPAIYLEDPPPGSLRVLRIFPNFSVTFTAPSLGEAGITIAPGEANLALSSHCYCYVASYPGDWRAQTDIMSPRDLWLASATPETFSKTLDYRPPVLRPLKDPPKLEEILSRAPKDPRAKAEWLKKQAFDLVAPIGEMWLARDPDLPFTYADFADGKSIDIDHASARQKEWLKNLYTNRPSVVKSMQQPAWEDLGKVTVKLDVQYQPSIGVVRLVTDERRISTMLSRPNSFSPREKMEWNVGGKTPLQFAANEAPPLYESVPGKGMGWLLTR